LNRPTHRTLLVVAFSYMTLAGCTDSDDLVGPTNNDPPVEPPGVSSTTDVQPILSASCALTGCHGGNSPQASMSLAADRTFSNTVDVTSSGYAPAKRIVPGDPEASVLYNKITDTGAFGGDMPPGPAALGAAEIETIRAWIEAGAENN
jgi:hypothetical protein